MVTHGVHSSLLQRVINPKCSTIDMFLVLQDTDNFYKVKWVAMARELARAGIVASSPLFFPGHYNTEQG